MLSTAIRTTADAPQDDAIATIAELGLSALSPAAALRRPVAELVRATIAAAGRSQHTARAYQTAIALFLQHLDRSRGDLLPADLATAWRPFAELVIAGAGDRARREWILRPAAAVLRLVSPADVDGFRAARESHGDGPNTASARVAAVRTFLGVAYREGVLTTDQAQALALRPYRQRQPRDRQPVGRRLAPAEVRALRAACDVGTAKGRRDLAMLDAMLFLGLRREEVAGLRLEGFHQDGGRWWLVLAGKGQKTRRLKVHDALFKSLGDWLGAAGGELGSEGPAFRAVNKGDRMSARGIQASDVGRLVAELGHRGGLAPLQGAGRLSPHDLRRTAARNAFENGASLLLVQAMLGHADPQTTAHYIGAMENDAETAVDFVRY